MRHPIVAIIVLAYAGWGGWDWAIHRPVHTADGVLAADEPQQRAVDHGAKLRRGRWTLTVRAEYVVTARILGRERYRFDSLSDLIPLDLALGWGPMSDNKTLRSLDISQANRFYFWRAPRDAPIDKASIIVHSANTHVIPADSAVAAQLSHLRPGQVVTLSGELVDAARDDGLWIHTSLAREDTGAGACEVLLVNEVRS